MGYWHLIGSHLFPICLARPRNNESSVVTGSRFNSKKSLELSNLFRCVGDCSSFPSAGPTLRNDERHCARYIHARCSRTSRAN